MQRSCRTCAAPTHLLRRRSRPLKTTAPAGGGGGSGGGGPERGGNHYGWVGIESKFYRKRILFECTEAIAAGSIERTHSVENTVYVRVLGIAAVYGLDVHVRLPQR